MISDSSAVIGALFGDEGKGLAVDHFSGFGDGVLVVRHNGGAQAGHTVERRGKRFVFHELSSGSLRHAVTYWAETFLPDLYKLREELNAFSATAGFEPRLLSHPDAAVTVIDDVLINMALEKSRGKGRHGSCGMGINEADLRNKAGFSLTVGEVLGFDAEALLKRLAMIRKEYVPARLAELGLSAGNIGEYGELLSDPAVLTGAAEEMLRGAAYIEPVQDTAKLFAESRRIVFEGAQGLLLDAENADFAPNVTASRTGLFNPLTLCGKYGRPLGAAVYVMRSYVTRHGAGRLPCECAPEELGAVAADRTNTENPWQGGLRYAFHESPEALARAVLADVGEWSGLVSLFITHLNETSGMVRFRSGDIPAEELAEHPAFGGRLYGVFLSFSPDGSGITQVCRAE